MKRFLAFLLALLLCVPALADEVIRMDDVLLTFAPMDGALILSQDSSDSSFRSVGMTRAEGLSFLEENGFAAVVVDPATMCIAYVSVHDGRSLGLQDKNDAELQTLCDDFAASFRLMGYEDVEVTIYEGAAMRWLMVVIPNERANGEPVVSLLLVTEKQGRELVVEAVCETEAEFELVQRMADSMDVVRPDSMAELAANGVSIRMTLPAGLTLQEDVTGLEAAPEEATGEIIGVLQSPDGRWYMQWQLTSGVRGDLERVSDSGLRALYEDRAKKKTAAGYSVTLKEACTDMQQNYIHLSYTMPGEWYAEEYYTKQGGWGVAITVYSCGAPLTEDEMELLREILSSQLITVAAQ